MDRGRDNGVLGQFQGVTVDCQATGVHGGPTLSLKVPQYACLPFTPFLPQNGPKTSFLPKMGLVVRQNGWSPDDFDSFWMTFFESSLYGDADGSQENDLYD